MSNKLVEQILGLWKSPILAIIRAVDGSLQKTLDSKVMTLDAKLAIGAPQFSNEEVYKIFAESYWNFEYTNNIYTFINAASTLTDEQTAVLALNDTVSEVFTSLNACHYEVLMQVNSIDHALKSIDEAHRSNVTGVCDGIFNFKEAVEAAISSSDAHSSSMIAKSIKTDKETRAALAAIANKYLQDIKIEYQSTSNTLDRYVKYHQSYIANHISKIHASFQLVSRRPTAVIDSISRFYAECNRIIQTNSDISAVKNFDADDPNMLIAQLIHIVKTKESVCVRKQSALSKIWWLFLIAILLAGVACLAVYAYNAHIPILYFAVGLGMIGLAFVGLCIYEFVAVRSLYHYTASAEKYKVSDTPIVKTGRGQMETISLDAVDEAYNSLTPQVL